MDVIAIYRPDGSVLHDSVGLTRKAARRYAATYCGTKWHRLWLKGWRCRTLV